MVNHFYQCGRVESVFVLCEQKGYALIEFNNVIAAHTALAMNGTLFKGHEIKVNEIKFINTLVIYKLSVFIGHSDGKL